MYLIVTESLRKFLFTFFLLSLYYASVAQVYVDHAATGANDGTSWTNAYTDLKAAIDVTSSGDIWVAQGTYYPDESDPGNRNLSFNMKNNVAIYGGFTGDGTETMLAERDYILNLTVLSGDLNDDDEVAGGSGTILTFPNNEENTYNVIENSGINNTAILDGLSIKGGNSLNPDNNGRGGGINNDNSSPTITNCTFSNNRAWQGGGMNNDNGSAPMLTNCTFSFNSSSYGGAIYNDQNGNSMIITNCIFSFNFAGAGAGVLNYFSSPTITNCKFSSNYAGSLGAGMFNEQSSPIINDCIFSSNNIGNGGKGAGMYNKNNGSPSLTNCVFSSNSTTQGSGIYNTVSCHPTHTNCTFYDNIAGSNGWTIFTFGFCNPTFTNCTFSNNSGGAMTNVQQTNCTLTNCILWGNGTSFSDNSATVTYSIVEGSTVYEGDGNTNMDPLFINSADPDGVDNIPGTADDGIRILTTSPGTGTGNPSVNTPTTDITGAARETDNPFDMGAYVYGIAGAGDLVISELLRNPIAVDDPFGEWFEVYNSTSLDINMEGIKIKNNGAFSHTIANSLVVPSEDYIVVGRNADTNVNGGLTFDYIIPDMILTNSGSASLIIEYDESVIDSIGWNTSFPGGGDGQSTNLIPDMLTAMANDDANNWCEPNATFGDGDKGTPGESNCCIPTVSITGITTICVDGTTNLSPTTGGTWTSSDDNIATVDNTGLVTGLGMGSATFTFTSDAGCFATTSAVTINLDDASFSYGASSYCKNDADADPTPTITLGGGMFSSSSSGLNINSSSGEIDLDMSDAGMYTITYTTAGTCPNAATFDITINPLEDASFNYDMSAYCTDAIDPTPMVSGLEGGSFSASDNLDLDESTGLINLDESTPGIYTITYTTAGICPNTATFDITINTLDNSSFSYDEVTYCTTYTDPSPLITGLEGGSFSASEDLELDESTGLINLDESTPGTYTITYTTNGTCPTSTSHEVTIDGICPCLDNMPNSFIGLDKDFNLAVNWSQGCTPTSPLMGPVTLMQDLDLSTADGLTVGNGGSIIISNGAVLNADVSLTLVGGSIINNGELKNTSTITYPGTFTNSGTYSGAGTFIGNFINNGTIDLSSN